MQNNNKAEKFERLAEKRMTDLLKKIRLVGNLANKNNYYYTEEHANQIIVTIEHELKDLKRKFLEETKEKEAKFTFKN